MTFSTLDQVQEIIQDFRADYVNKIRARQAEVYALMVRPLKRCDASRIPVPFLMAAAQAVAAAMNITTPMATGKRRLLIIVSGASGFAGTPQLSITGPVGVAVDTDVLDITRNGTFLTHIAFDSIPTSGDPISANPDLITAGGQVAVYEWIGDISDIEARWVAGLFEDEVATHLTEESRPPEEHVWIQEAKARWFVFEDEYCTGTVKGQVLSKTVSRGFP